MALKLVKCERKYERQIVEMLEEWTEYNKNHDDVNKTPWAIFKMTIMTLTIICII